MKIFIPIKTNSQRVPRKNFRTFGHLPLYQYVLEKFNNFEIIIDTDSDEILETIKNISTLKHVITYKRNPKLIGDNVSVNLLIAYFLNSISNDEPIVQTHVTTPFLKENTILHAATYLNNGYDSIISCNLIQKRLWFTLNSKVIPINHNPLTLEPTQNLLPVYEENSAFYIFSKNSFQKYNNRIGSNPLFQPISEEEAMDIDTEEDWKKCIQHLYDSYGNKYPQP